MPVLLLTFIVSAKAYGLGTCWVTDMDKDEIKDLLGIPHQDYIACLTPIGYRQNIFLFRKGTRLVIL